MDTCLKLACLFTTKVLNNSQFLRNNKSSPIEAIPYTLYTLYTRPDRGGTGLGGPLWTDFSTLQKADEEQSGPLDFVQGNEKC